MYTVSDMCVIPPVSPSACFKVRLASVTNVAFI